MNKLIKYSVILMFLMLPLNLMAASLTDDENVIIKNIEDNFNSFKVIKAKFKQVDSGKNKDSGWFVFDKFSSKARIEYNKSPLRIIINKNSIMMEQKDVKEKTFIPLVNSPFKYLLDDHLTFSNPSLKILSFEETKSSYEVSLTSTDNPDIGSITLIFDKKYNLIKWIVKNPDNSYIEISLINPVVSNKKIASSIFNTQKIRNISYDGI